MRYQLSPEWDIQIPDHFQARKEGEHMVFWATGCTVLCTVFAYTGERQRETLLANLRARAEVRQLQTIEEIEGILSRFGYMQPEEIQPGHTRLALHAFTTAPHGCLQSSFYIDDASELQTPLKIWDSVRHFPEGSGS